MSAYALVQRNDHPCVLDVEGATQDTVIQVKEVKFYQFHGIGWFRK